MYKQQRQRNNIQATLEHLLSDSQKMTSSMAPGDIPFITPRAFRFFALASPFSCPTFSRPAIFLLHTNRPLGCVCARVYDDGSWVTFWLTLDENKRFPQRRHHHRKLHHRALSSSPRPNSNSMIPVWPNGWKLHCECTSMSTTAMSVEIKPQTESTIPVGFHLYSSWKMQSLVSFYTFFKLGKHWRKHLKCSNRKAENIPPLLDACNNKPLRGETVFPPPPGSEGVSQRRNTPRRSTWITASSSSFELLDSSIGVRHSKLITSGQTCWP